MRYLCAVATLGSVASYIATYALLRAETLFRPYNGANVGGHASQRDTCHLCTTYALLVAGGNAVPPLREPATWDSSPLGRLVVGSLTQMVRWLVRCLGG